MRAIVLASLLTGCSWGNLQPKSGGHVDGGGPFDPDGGSHSGNDGGSSIDSDGGNPFGGDGGSSSSSGSGSVYCGPVDSTECGCGNGPASGRSQGAHCGSSDVSSPSLCCATAAWPSPTPGALDIGCVCSQIFCELDTFGVCQCGFAPPSQGDKPVASCSGVSCCRGRSTVAPTCACYDSNVPCSADEEQVPSCAPSTLRCTDQQVSACN